MRHVLNSNYPNYEVILFDNNSQDGSLEFSEKKYEGNPRVRIIKSKVNLGFARGNNIVAKHARGQLLAFLNNDTEVDSNWLLELVNIIESDSKIGVVQSKLLQMDRRHFDSAGDVLCTYGIAVSRGAGEEDHGQYDQVEEIFSARGAAMLIRSELFLEVGLFDSDFQLQLEDVDLSWRVRLHGYKVVFAPKSLVYHKGSAGLRKVPKANSVFMSQRNRLIMVLKNYDSINLIKYFPPIFVLTLTGFVFQPSEVNFRLKALFWVLSNFRKIWVERQVVQKYVRAVPDSQVLKYMPNINSFILMKATQN
jgi:hypothetical protein